MASHPPMRRAQYGPWTRLTVFFSFSFLFYLPPSPHYLLLLFYILFLSFSFPVPVAATRIQLHLLLRLQASQPASRHASQPRDREGVEGIVLSSFGLGRPRPLTLSYHVHGMQLESVEEPTHQSTLQPKQIPDSKTN